MVVAIAAAIAAAALFAVASALQHRSAGLVSAGPASREGFTGFVSRTLRHPLWIIGSVADVAGLGFHALALRDGPLTLVQPLLVTGVVFALPLRQLLEHRRPARSELGWAAALVVGLALCLVTATPTNGSGQPADPIPAAASITVIGLGILGCWWVGHQSSGRTTAVALAAAAGLAFAATAGLLKETMTIVNRGLVPLFTTWPLYALVVVGALGLLLNQLAYQAGPLRFSLPVITTVDPIAGLAIGVAVFDEHFRDRPADLLLEALGLVVVVISAVSLTRSDPDRSRPGGAPTGETTRPDRPPSRERQHHQP